MDMVFKKYNSIEQNYRTKFIDMIKANNLDTIDYIVQEKIHGSNFSFISVDGINFRAAKRTSILEPNESFYNYKPVMDKLLDKMKALWTLVKADYPDMFQLTVFGELFGGLYPHPEVKKDNTASVIQKGVYYSPSNNFYAFDIMINAEVYLDVDIINNYFEKVNMFYARTIYRGSLTDCLNYPNDFQSTIPEQLGLPPIENNIIEGIVIRPIKSLYLPIGSRVILKSKNEKWSEIKTKKKKTQTPIISNDLKLCILNVKNYITKNRLNNVISHIGEINKNKIGAVLKLFSQDVISDFRKDYPIYDKLNKKDQTILRKEINKEVIKEVKLIYLNN